MAYIEKTDEQKNIYALQDITENQMAAINSLLNGVKDKDLLPLQQAFYNEFGLVTAVFWPNATEKLFFAKVAKGVVNVSL